jgi:alpha-mannosidase
VKKIIQNKQLEIVNGGWSANDEASPHFDDIINNMMLGHEFLDKEFGVKPEIGWDIDTFGHSDTNTRLFAEMGFDAMFFSRLDHNDKDWRGDKKEKALTFLWRPSTNHFGKQH